MLWNKTVVKGKTAYYGGKSGKLRINVKNQSGKSNYWLNKNQENEFSHF